mgnify:CR=1 FL=1
MDFEKQFTERLGDAKKLLILGVGNDIRQDDGVGPKIIRDLQGKVSGKVKLVDAGTVPESFTGVIKSFKPTHILIIDAAGMGTPPGYMKFIEKDQILGVSFSTHQMPLSLLIEYLESEMDSKIYLLGIQPASNEFGGNLTSEVKKAKERIVNLILNIFKK